MSRGDIHARAANAKRSLAAGRWARKRFFFEKKQQKTFVNPGPQCFHQHGPDEQKFFARFFSKSAASFLRSAGIA
jgi:hypothetical protein